VEIQDAIGAENRDLPPDRQMWFRIGINLGDVMNDNGDIYGEGVNTASRLEAIADPGGIMVSSSVYQFAHKQLAVGFDYAGTRQVKPGEEPVAGYRVRIGGDNAPPKEEFLGTGNSEDPSPQGGQGAEPGNAWRQMEYHFNRFRDWFDRQDYRVRRSVMMIGFFFAINLFFGNIAHPWFIFPSAPFFFYILMKRREPPVLERPRHRARRARRHGGPHDD